MLNYLNMEEEKEYTYGNDIYKKNNGLLYVKYQDRWKFSNRSFKQAMKMNFQEAPWKPELNEDYFYPAFYAEEYWSSRTYTNNDYDKRIIKTVGVYKTKEEAMREAGQLGWSDQDFQIYK